MANNNLSTLPAAQVKYTNDMTGGGGLTGGNVALYNAAPSDTSPNYTRNGTTQFYYEWDKYGKITNPSGGAGGNGIGSDAAGTGISGCAPKSGISRSERMGEGAVQTAPSIFPQRETELASST